MAMVLAGLPDRAGLKLTDRQVYVATLGGVKITELVADLAVAISVASSVMDKPIHPCLIAIGEVGLAGEVRRVGGLEKWLAEATRLHQGDHPGGCAEPLEGLQADGDAGDVRPSHVRRRRHPGRPACRRAAWRYVVEATPSEPA